MTNVELAGYDLVGRVATTRTATIWKAHDPRLDRFVALKELAPALDREILAREARLLAGLDHPHIVRVIDLVEAGGRSYLVEDWVEGASLGAVRDHAKRLSAPQAVGVLRGALQGLAYAHDRNVVHGDISPGNILIDLQGTSKLIDFGAAQAGDTDAGAGRSSSRGTAGYRAPEVGAGAPATRRSDVYAVAAVLADLLGDARVSLAGPPALDGIAAPIAAVLSRALAADPATRPPDAGALLAELEPAADRALGSWLPLAGVSGLVSATLGAGGVSLVAAETGTGGTTAAAVAGLAPVATAVPRSARRWVLAGGAGVGVAAIVVAALLLTRGGGANTEAASGSTTSSTPVSTSGSGAATSPLASTPATVSAAPVVSTPATVSLPSTTSTAPITASLTPTTASLTPTIASLTPITRTIPSRTATPTTTAVATPAVGFSGTYQATVVVTRYDNWADHKLTVGQKLVRTWKAVSTCTATGCTVTVKSSSGSTFRYTLTKNVYVHAEKIDAPCLNSETGEPTGEHDQNQAGVTLTPTIVKGVVVSLEGTYVERQLTKCTNQQTGLGLLEETFAATRTGP